MTSSVLVEDNVSRHILSFTHENFLFTRTVCKAWYKNGADTNSKTNHHRAVDSVSTLDEAFHHGFCDPEFYGTYTLALQNKSDISVFEHFVVDCELGLDEDDVQWASGAGRIDVLQLYKKKGGATFDEKVLHFAVRYGHLETLVYLMDLNCPVDYTLIDWGYNLNPNPKLKMRSMEMAVEDGRIDIVKQLRTVDYPFTYDTFHTAADGESFAMLRYLQEEADRDFHDHDSYLTKFIHFVEGGNYKKVEMMIKSDVVSYDYLGLDVAFRNEDRQMVHVFAKFMGFVTDTALIFNNVSLAKYLIHEFRVMPTYDAYRCIIGYNKDDRKDDDWLIDSLNWLYDEERCPLENGKSLSYTLSNQSPVVQKWFQDRLQG